MKKVYIMLLSLALFAVVGGALAFKAKFASSYCTTNAFKNAQGVWTCPQGGNQACALLLGVTTVVAGLPGMRCCTTPTNGPGNPCNGITTCSTLTSLIID